MSATGLGSRQGLCGGFVTTPAEVAEIERRIAELKAEHTERDRPRSDVPGVYWVEKIGRWQVTLSVYGSQKSYGSFPIKEEAETKAKEIRRLYPARVKGLPPGEIPADPPAQPDPRSALKCSDTRPFPSIKPPPLPLPAKAMPIQAPSPAPSPALSAAAAVVPAKPSEPERPSIVTGPFGEALADFETAAQLVGWLGDRGVPLDRAKNILSAVLSRLGG